MVLVLVNPLVLLLKLEVSEYTCGALTLHVSMCMGGLL